MHAQIVIATDARAIDEGLRRGLHVMFTLEGLGLVLGGQMVVFNTIALTLEQILGLEAKGAKLITTVGLTGNSRLRSLAHKREPWKNNTLSHARVG